MLSPMAEQQRFDADFEWYYGKGEERERLSTQARLEHIRTRDILRRFLPPSPRVVCDIGGGAGAYAIPLASEGYEVHLVDPFVFHVEQARHAAAESGVTLASARVGDARKLEGFDDMSADVVLLLGPLYHLTERGERLSALGETRRILRPGGVLIAAYITRFASLYDWFMYADLDGPGAADIVRQDLGGGQHRNPMRRGGWFTTAYFHHPDEARAELEEAGLKVDHVLAVEGPGRVIPDKARWLDDPSKRDTLLGLIEAVESEPSIIGASDHIIAIAHRS